MLSSGDFEGNDIALCSHNSQQPSFPLLQPAELFVVVFACVIIPGCDLALGPADMIVFVRPDFGINTGLAHQRADGSPQIVWRRVLYQLASFIDLAALACNPKSPTHPLHGEPKRWAGQRLASLHVPENPR